MDINAEPAVVGCYCIVCLTDSLLISVFLVYYRALVNFTDSLVYGPELEDIFSVAFNEISQAVVDTVRPIVTGWTQLNYRTMLVITCYL